MTISGTPHSPDYSSKEALDEAARKNAKKTSSAEEKKLPQDDPKLKKMMTWMLQQRLAAGLEEAFEAPEEIDEDGSLEEELAESGDSEITEGASKHEGEKKAEKKRCCCKSKAQKKLAKSRHKDPLSTLHAPKSMKKAMKGDPFADAIVGANAFTSVIPQIKEPIHTPFQEAEESKQNQTSGENPKENSNNTNKTKAPEDMHAFIKMPPKEKNEKKEKAEHHEKTSLEHHVDKASIKHNVKTSEKHHLESHERKEEENSKLSEKEHPKEERTAVHKEHIKSQREDLEHHVLAKQVSSSTHEKTLKEEKSKEKYASPKQLATKEHPKENRTTDQNFHSANTPLKDTYEHECKCHEEASYQGKEQINQHEDELEDQVIYSLPKQENPNETTSKGKNSKSQTSSDLKASQTVQGSHEKGDQEHDESDQKDRSKNSSPQNKLKSEDHQVCYSSPQQTQSNKLTPQELHEEATAKEQNSEENKFLKSSEEEKKVKALEKETLKSSNDKKSFIPLNKEKLSALPHKEFLKHIDEHIKSAEEILGAKPSEDISEEVYASLKQSGKLKKQLNKRDKLEKAKKVQSTDDSDDDFYDNDEIYINVDESEIDQKDHEREQEEVFTLFTYLREDRQFYKRPLHEILRDIDCAPKFSDELGDLKFNLPCDEFIEVHPEHIKEIKDREGIEDVKQPNMHLHIHHHTHLSNPFHDQKGVSIPKPKEESAIPSSFDLFPDRYRFEVSDSLTDEAEATAATYSEEHVRSVYNSFQEELEVHARACQLYVSDYISNVQGTRLQVDDGQVQWTTDLIPNVKSEAYKAWLDQTGKLRNKYLHAKNQIREIEANYSMMHMRYAIEYDQNEMIEKMWYTVCLNYSDIGFLMYNQYIQEIEKRINEKLQKAQPIFQNMENNLKFEIEGIEVNVQSFSHGKTKAAKKDLAMFEKGIREKKEQIAELKQASEDWGQSLNNKKNFSPKQLNQLLNKLGTIFPSWTASGTNLQEIQNILDGCKELFKKRAKERELYMKRIKVFFAKTQKMLSNNIHMVNQQKKEFSGLFKKIHVDKNPFDSPLEFLQKLSLFFHKRETQKSIQNIKGMWGEAKKIRKGFLDAINDNINEKTMNSFREAQKTWIDANKELKKDKKIVAELGAAFEKKCKHCPIPMDQRYTKTSSYGYSLVYLDEYRRTMDAMNSADDGFNDYSQLIYQRPKRVSTTMIPTAWRQISVYREKLKWAKITLYIAIAAVSFATLLATISLGLASAALITAVSFLEGIKKKIHNLKYVKIPAAQRAYEAYAHELPVMQIHRDQLWKTKITMKAENLVQEVSKKQEESVRKEQLANKSLQQQMKNMELIIRTMDRIPARKQNDAKEQSFM